MTNSGSAHHEQPDEAESLIAIRNLSSADENIATSAFERLIPGCRRFLDKYFWQSLGIREGEQREDLIQTTLLRLWGSRKTFKPLGVGAWYGFVRRTAYHCYIDQLRKHKTDTLPDNLDIDSVSDAEVSVVENILTAINTGLFFQLADEVFLDEQAPLTEEERDLRLLAAQLFYLDGESWRDIVTILAGSHSAISITRPVLDLWLTDPGTIRRLAYYQLYHDNETLARFLQSANNQETAPAWTDEEKKAIQWRYRYGLSADQILARTDCELGDTQLTELLDRCRDLLPFKKIMQQMILRFRRRGNDRPLSVLTTNSLWQRLAFQYCYADQLPHKEIMERSLPAAEIAGFHLTLAMLNVWLSNGRLLRRVAQRWQQQEGGTNVL